MGGSGSSSENNSPSSGASASSSVLNSASISHAKISHARKLSLALGRGAHQSAASPTAHARAPQPRARRAPGSECFQATAPVKRLTAYTASWV